MRNLISVVMLSMLTSICVGQQQPNIILINLDDVDVDILNPTSIGSRFPEMSRFVTHGKWFPNMHVTTPLCGPSRACLFRSQYAHNTGIRTNSLEVVPGNGMPGGHRLYVEKGYDHDDLSTWMQATGYHTMLVGKYLNNDVVNIVPPGWDEFYSSRGNLYYQARRFTNRVNPRGAFEIVSDGVNRTVAEMNDVLQLIDEHQFAQPGNPFFLYFAPVAAHATQSDEQMIEPQYENWWPNLAVPRTPDFGELDMSDKLGSMWMLPELSTAFENDLDAQFRNRILSLKTVDDQLGRLFAKLDELDIADDTYIFLTSDNGWSGGHHRLTGKSNPYDRATNVPFYAWGPGIGTATARHLLAHIDIAPTLMQVASGSAPAWVDGQSFYDLLFAPLLLNENLWRSPVLIENWTSNRMRGLVEPIDMVSTTLRLFDESYLEWFNGDKEYYDLKIDPQQLENRYDSLSAARKQELKGTIRSLKAPMLPLVSVTVPFQEEEILGRESVLEGLAEDDHGLWSVKIALRDETTRRYWNGTNWQTGFLQLTADLTNQGGQTALWKLPLNIPANLATSETKKIWIWCVDVTGNYDRNVRTATFKLDVEGPAITMISPTRNEVASNPAHFAGKATDDSRVTNVRLVIMNRNGNRYWTGNGLSNEFAFVNANLNNSGLWTYDAALPAGRYYASARGFDEHSNYTRQIASQVFRIQ